MNSIDSDRADNNYTLPQLHLRMLLNGVITTTASKNVIGDGGI